VLIEWIIPESEYLLQDIICLASEGIVVHPVGDILATVLDQSNGLLRDDIVNVHVVDERGCIERYLHLLAYDAF